MRVLTIKGNYTNFGRADERLPTRLISRTEQDSHGITNLTMSGGPIEFDGCQRSYLTVLKPRDRVSASTGDYIISVDFQSCVEVLFLSRGWIVPNQFLERLNA